MEQVLDYSVHASGVHSMMDNFMMNKFISVAATNDRKDERLADINVINNNMQGDVGNNSSEGRSSIASMYNRAPQDQNGVNTSVSLWRTFSNFSESLAGLDGDRALSGTTPAQPLPTDSIDERAGNRGDSLSSESAASSVDQFSDVDSEDALNSPGIDADAENGQLASRDYTSHPSPSGARSASAISDINPVRGNGQNGKPPHSYIALISMAILSSPSRRMLLGDIYSYVMNTFPYYNNKEKAWRNSIRHNLSLNECFVKAGRSDAGKGHYWSIHHNCIEDFARGDFRRRQARRRARKHSASTSVNSLHDGLNDNYYTLGSHYGADLFRGRRLDVSSSLGLCTVRGGEADCLQLASSASVGVFGTDRIGSAFPNLLPDVYHIPTDPSTLSSLIPPHQPYLTQSAVSAIHPPAAISSCSPSVFSPLHSSQPLHTHPQYRSSPVYPSTLPQMAYPWCVPTNDTRSYNPASSTPSPQSPKGEFSFRSSESCPSVDSPDSKATPPLDKEVTGVANMRNAEVSDTPRSAAKVSLAGLPGTTSGGFRATTKIRAGLPSLHDASCTLRGLQDTASPPFILPTTGSTVPPLITPQTSPMVMDPTRNVSWLPSPPTTRAAGAFPLTSPTEASRIPAFMDYASSSYPVGNQGSAVSVGQHE